MPFPWSSVGRKPIENREATPVEEPKYPSWMSSLPPTLQSNQSLRAIAEEAASMGCIKFRIPKDPNMVAGRVLQHSISVIESLFYQHRPLTFKFGYTHNPCFRWANTLYGCANGTNTFSDMVVLWISGEPSGPAMLEASLIHMFKSI